MAVRQDVLIFWKPGNFMAEMQGCHALKQFVRKGGISFSRISHTWCLSGSVMCCEIKKLEPLFVNNNERGRGRGRGREGVREREREREREQHCFGHCHYPQCI